MRLKNKKTGEIVPASNIAVGIGKDGKWYDSLAELNSEWEDAPEEPKEHWCVTMYGGITRIKDDEEPIDDLKEIGNYFNSKEDAYDAWDKLKAWKRLKDKGFRVIDYGDEDIRYEIKDRYDGCLSDLETVLFGGEE